MAARCTSRRPEPAVTSLTASSLSRSRSAVERRLRRAGLAAGGRSRSRGARGRASPRAPRRARSRPGTCRRRCSRRAAVRVASSPVTTTSRMLTAGSKEADTLASSEPTVSPGRRRAASASTGGAVDELAAGRQPPIGRRDVNRLAGRGSSAIRARRPVALRRQQRHGEHEPGHEDDDRGHEAGVPPDRAADSPEVDRRVPVGIGGGAFGWYQLLSHDPASRAETARRV